MEMLTFLINGPQNQWFYYWVIILQWFYMAIFHVHRHRQDIMRNIVWKLSKWQNISNGLARMLKLVFFQKVVKNLIGGVNM